MGETSAAILRTLGLGKPCIVSDDAWFSELPDSVVLKVNNAQAEKDLCAHIKRLISQPEERVALGKRAQQYIREEYDPHDIAKQIISFMDEHGQPRSGPAR